MTDDSAGTKPVIPTIFCDGILNLANNKNIVKFYLARLDPSLQIDEQANTVIVGQVIMPMDAFIETFTFMEYWVSKIMRDGIISADQIDSSRRKREADLAP